MKIYIPRFHQPRLLCRWQSSLAGLLLAAIVAEAAPAVAQSAGGALQLNDSGDAVVELQRRLTNLGYYDGEITGFLGSQTKEAIVQFQQEMGLTADGIVGAATEAALQEPSSQAEPQAAGESAEPRAVVRVGDSGEQIAELQRRLTDLGYYNGSISGTFDRPTEEAIQRFQRDNGLPADGIVGAATETALRQPAVPTSPSSTSINSAPNSTAASAPSSAARRVAALRLGDTGTAVSELQSQLSEQGFYKGEISGNYDAQTQTAVTSLQRSRGLTVDGIAGQQVTEALGMTAMEQTSQGSNPQTWQQLQQTRLEARQARQEADRAKQEAEQARLEAEQARLVLNQNLQEGQYSVSELQRHLQRRGYNPGEVNGVLSPDTQTAITEAQQRYGLSESDFAGDGLP
ncbi:peptidoglycan-binding protein [Phormidium tenue FACHB-886]|nr:peptidoglycan-binding protein [Phormidium tenue FACHB-886]